MMAGAYGTAMTVEHGGSFWLGLLVGVLAAVAFGLILGLPTLRLRADFLAIVTIAAAEIMRLTARAGALEDVTRGVFGIQRFADRFYELNPYPTGRWGVGGLDFTERQLWVMTVGWVLVVVSSLLVARLMSAPWGRVLREPRRPVVAVCDPLR